MIGTWARATAASAVQQAGFARALTSRHEGLIPAPIETAGDLRRAPTPQEIAAGGFSLSTRELRQQAYTSSGPDGENRAIVTLGGGGREPTGPPQLRGEDGNALDLTPAGPPTLLDGYTFTYYVAGNQQRPARVASIEVPRPPAPAPPAR